MTEAREMHGVLITGGAGFIGSHLADELIAHGYRVRVLDSLSEQVHGEHPRRPDYLHPEAELRSGDICDPSLVSEALDGIDAVFHFAARVGVGQSMYRVRDYVETNDLGTAVLMEAIAARRVRRLIAASSMSIYGEGLYADPDGRIVEGVRHEEQLRNGRWEPVGPGGAPLTPLPTPETKCPSLASVYALTKFDQEQLCMVLGRAYGIPTAGLRFFNVYGERQALSNPYTGALAIFASRLLNRRPPLIFEDGEQRRDFVHVRDVARACRLALESPAAPGEVLNIGSGHPVTIGDIARRAARVLGVRVEPRITGRYRRGDIRHCFADVTRAREVLGYEARIDLEEGLGQLAEWLVDRTPVDLSERASEELVQRGLAV